MTLLLYKLKGHTRWTLLHRIKKWKYSSSMKYVISINSLKLNIIIINNNSNNTIQSDMYVKWC